MKRLERPWAQAEWLADAMAKNCADGLNRLPTRNEIWAKNPRASSKVTTNVDRVPATAELAPMAIKILIGRKQYAAAGELIALSSFATRAVAKEMVGNSEFARAVAAALNDGC